MKTRKQIPRISGKTLTMVTISIFLFVCFIFFLFVTPKLAERVGKEKFKYEGQPRLGDVQAPVKMMEFADFKCPACKIFHEKVLSKLKKEYIDTGKVQMYFTNFQWIGEDSFFAGVVGESIYHQDNDSFWKFYDAIYRNQKSEFENWATPEFLFKLIEENVPTVDLNIVASDINNSTYDDLVLAEYELARKLKIDEVPAIYVNGKKIKDPLNYAALKKAINEELTSKGS